MIIILLLGITLHTNRYKVSTQLGKGYLVCVIFLNLFFVNASLQYFFTIWGGKLGAIIKNCVKCCFIKQFFKQYGLVFSVSHFGAFFSLSLYVVKFRYEKFYVQVCNANSYTTDGHKYAISSWVYSSNEKMITIFFI